jgi:hypothetical protein
MRQRFKSLLLFLNEHQRLFRTTGSHEKLSYSLDASRPYFVYAFLGQETGFLGVRA